MIFCGFGFCELLWCCSCECFVVPFRALRCRSVWVNGLCVGICIWFGALFAVYGLLEVWVLWVLGFVLDCGFLLVWWVLSLRWLVVLAC